MPNGVIIIDKPREWTSMDICAKLRGIFHEKRIGHGGTLDPMATGVLPVFVGRATRAVEFATEGKKEYIAGLKLGVMTNTQDTTGQVLEQRPVQVDRETLKAALEAFRGDILQIPPMYSAIKRDGKKLYELARAGKEVERPPRPVTIYDCMSALRRTEAAGFTLEQAVTLEQLQAAPDPAALLAPVDGCFQEYPAVTIGEGSLKKAQNGNPFPCDASDGIWRAYGPDGRFLLLGRCEGGIMTTIKSFFEV